MKFIVYSPVEGFQECESLEQAEAHAGQLMQELDAALRTEVYVGVFIKTAEARETGVLITEAGPVPKWSLMPTSSREQRFKDVFTKLNAQDDRVGVDHG